LGFVASITARKRGKRTHELTEGLLQLASKCSSARYVLRFHGGFGAIFACWLRIASCFVASLHVLWRASNVATPPTATRVHQLEGGCSRWGRMPACVGGRLLISYHRICTSVCCLVPVEVPQVLLPDAHVCLPEDPSRTHTFGFMNFSKARLCADWFWLV
jgi:hypothetical protein